MIMHAHPMSNYKHLYCYCSCIYSCQTNSADDVDYQQFIELLNWKDYPLSKDMEPKVCHNSSQRF